MAFITSKRRFKPFKRHLDLFLQQNNRNYYHKQHGRTNRKNSRERGCLLILKFSKNTISAILKLSRLNYLWNMGRRGNHGLVYKIACCFKNFTSKILHRRIIRNRKFNLIIKLQISSWFRYQMYSPVREDNIFQKKFSDSFKVMFNCTYLTVNKITNPKNAMATGSDTTGIIRRFSTLKILQELKGLLIILIIRQKLLHFFRIIQKL